MVPQAITREMHSSARRSRHVLCTFDREPELFILHQLYIANTDRSWTKHLALLLQPKSTRAKWLHELHFDLFGTAVDHRNPEASNLPRTNRFSLGFAGRGAILPSVGQHRA